MEHNKGSAWGSVRRALYHLTYDMFWSPLEGKEEPVLLDPQLWARALEVQAGSMWRAGPYTVGMELRIIQETVCKEKVALDFLWGLFQL